MSKFQELKKENLAFRIFIQYLQITLGVVLMNLGFFFFLNPSRLVLGGMMGVATMLEPALQKIGTWFTPSIFFYIVNIITLIIGGICLGKDFFIKTIYASLVSPTILLGFEKIFKNPNYFYDSMTETPLLICLICGTILIGIGIGITIKNNGCTGGMDVIQKIMSKYLHMPMSKTMFFTDWVVVFLAGLTITNHSVNYNLELVVYGVVGVFTTGIIIDAIALNAKTRRTVYVITENPQVIKDLIYLTIERGVTFVDATGAYTGDRKTMVICTMEKNEAYKIVDLIKRNDETAFTFVTTTKEVAGDYDTRGII